MVLPYTAILVPFNLFRFAAAESALINQVWQFLLHKVVNNGNCLLKSVLVGAGDVKVQRGVLYHRLAVVGPQLTASLTAAVAMFLSG